MVMNVSNNIANAAYKAASQIKGIAGGAGADEGGPSFLDMVADGLKGAVETQRTAEQLTKDAVAGKADINEVILAVQSADVELSAISSIREKLIAAYQDILRMTV